MSTRSPNQVSTASEFIFAPPEKLASEFLWHHHQPLYIHPQELNTERSSICSTVRRVCCSLRHNTIRTKLYISIPCFGRQSPRIGLATPTQFPLTTGRTEAGGVDCWNSSAVQTKSCFNFSTISTCKATLLQGAPSCHSPHHQRPAPSPPDHHWKGMGPWIACSRVTRLS